MSTTRRFTLLSTTGLAVMLVIGLLLGYAAGFLTPRSGGPSDTSPEAGFARDMSTHHAQAVAMGMLAQRKGENVAVRGFGGDIALTGIGATAAAKAAIEAAGGSLN